ncbi:MAG: hypothetical protein JW976_05335 [Syntrophaceae bacterium]|nr:hypothetical protein [Syntrophaceae bacterium]
MKVKTPIKAKVILFLSFLIPFVFVFIYVWNTSTDLVGSDDMYLIKGGFIESYLKGTMTFDDLWRPIHVSRMLGYNLMQIANIRLSSMNSQILVFLTPFFMLASAILIYREYRKSLILECSSEFIAATFLVLTLIIFNIIQWEGLQSDCGLLYQSSMPFFIASFIYLELFLLRGDRKYLPAVFILMPLAMLVFNGRLYISFIPTLCSIFMCYLLNYRSNLTKDFWLRALLIGLFIAVTATLYLWGINFKENTSYNLSEVFTHPLEVSEFLLAAFASSVVGVDAFFACTYISFDTMLIIGLIIVILYVFALALFFRSRMYERTYLPLFLILQTFFYLGFITIGRFELGKGYGMASRYTCVSIYGLAAMVWIFMFILAHHKKPKALLKGAIFTGFLIIFSGHFLTSIAVWNVRPERKAYFEKGYDIAFRVDTATPEELSHFLAEPEQVRDSLLLLRKYKLNAYREKSAKE